MGSTSTPDASFWDSATERTSNTTSWLHFLGDDDADDEAVDDGRPLSPDRSAEPPLAASEDVRPHAGAPVGGLTDADPAAVTDPGSVTDWLDATTQLDDLLPTRDDR